MNREMAFSWSREGLYSFTICFLIVTSVVASFVVWSVFFFLHEPLYHTGFLFLICFVLFIDLPLLSALARGADVNHIAMRSLDKLELQLLPRQVWINEEHGNSPQDMAHLQNCSLILQFWRRKRIGVRIFFGRLHINRWMSGIVLFGIVMNAFTFLFKGVLLPFLENYWID